MEEVTLKVNLIVRGQHYLRGSIIDKALLPLHLRTNKYVARGAVHVNKVMPVDIVEIGEEIEELDVSPMHELTPEEIIHSKRRK
jgi:hypothetical protein